jgi:hypothetical protein
MSAVHYDLLRAIEIERVRQARQARRAREVGR